ncbi:hypothetical protein ABPG75_012642 [Micractinium tetrahymenae]
MSAAAAPAVAAPTAPAAAATAAGDPRLAAVQADLERLSASKGAWARASLDERIAILKEIRGRILDQLLPWCRATAGVRCTTRDGQVAGDVMSTAVGTAAYGRTVAAGRTFLAALCCWTRPALSGNWPGCPLRARHPLQGWRERYLSLLGASGCSVQLYLQPGEEDSQGHFYREPHGGKLAAQVGAQPWLKSDHHLSLSDVLHMAIVEGCVVLLKYHPIMQPVAPFIDYVLEPLARRGFYASSTDPELAVTQHMLYSPLTDCVHMTGGTATHDAIVWGGDPAEQARRRAANDPLLKVPITSELGCVTPWLVVPGLWSDKDVTHHARALAEALSSNCSCNCLAPKVLLLAEGWPQADQFVAAVKKELAELPLPAPYYPGIRQRYEAFRQAYPQAEAISSGRPADPGAACGEPLPFLVNELPAFPDDPASEYAFNVPVRHAGPASSLEEGFLQEAVRAANEDLWGTLSCTLLVHPDTQAKYGAAVQEALDGLRYGCVTVNAWSAMGFVPMAGHWGAFAGDQTIADVGSGIGGVHNVYLFDRPQKAAVRAPFICAAQPLPEKYAPMPLGLAKAIAGLMHSGPWGALRMLMAR